jgi:hypothetical protein
MKKFEIINNKWIKMLYSGNEFSIIALDAIKIDAICKIYCKSPSSANGHIHLYGYSSDMSIEFIYSPEEVDDFNKDLDFLKNLLGLV